MKCENISDLFAGYLDNELSGEERRRVDEHIASCSRCRLELEGLASMKRDLSEALKLRADEAGPSTNIWEKIKTEIEPGPSFWEWIGNAFKSPVPVWRAITPVALVLVAVVAMWQTGAFNTLSTTKNTTDNNQTTLTAYNATVPMTTTSNEASNGGVTKGISQEAARPSTSVTTTATVAGFGAVPAATTPQMRGAADASGTKWSLPVSNVFNDPGTPINIASGSQFTITLNLSSGDKWVLSSYDSSLMEVTPSDIIVDNNVASNAFNGTQYFNFTTLRIGNAPVTFSLENSANKLSASQTFNVAVK
jgi:anti-sigma factor RsiW